MKPILLLNGPTLNLLGEREPEIYGSTTLAQIVASLQKRATELGLTLTHRQSNSEGELIDAIHSARHDAFGLIINPGAYSHTSVAIRDALSVLKIPIIEVHLSNIHAREEFRRHSYVSEAATAVICGLKAEGYQIALESLARLLLPSK